MNATCTLGIPAVCEATEASLNGDVRQVVCSVSGVAMLAFVVGNGVHQLNVTWMPESLVVVLLGVLLGAVLYVTPIGGAANYLDEDLVSLLFNWMLSSVALPVIIFESGWSLRLRDFVSQLGYIMLFAIIGTIINVLVVTGFTLWTSEYHGINNLRTALAYASLISSVDPVATLATFTSLNVDPLLFILVFGESQINDAVAITLFESLNEAGLEDPRVLCFHMAKLLFGSIGFGFLLGSCFILVMRFTRMGHCPPQAILFVACSSIFTYSCAEILGLSGIITVLFESILMGTYTPCHLSTETMSLTSFLLKQAASISDTMIFMACGVISVFVFVSSTSCAQFAAFMILFCMVARAIAILPLAGISNAIKMMVSKKLPAEKKHMITAKHMFMMWHSGLRGGVSLVLVMKLEKWVDEDEGSGTKEMLINATFVVIVFYLLIFGSTAGTCLRCVGLPLGEQVPEGASLYQSSDRNGCGWRSVKYTRKHILHPVLVGPHPGKEDEHPMADLMLQADRAKKHVKNKINAREIRLRAIIHSLFGSTDPAHVEDAEDLENDLESVSSWSSEEAESDDGERDADHHVLQEHRR
eukprot:TRINITY_DN12384_c0_g3_i1.p1 TRINITY_DN12384_c0_g3~~TRINITY_DN12384_c0_g3_i1.p1  ORF type:complete len:585 (-),score=116.66 TRINITY_DN12384_c0_g3_i1:134-1888(-)